MSRHSLANIQTIERPVEPQGPSHDVAAAQAVLLGESLAVRRLRAQVERIGPYFRTAVVRGETGAGKRLIAQTLQAASPLRDGPFVACRASALAAAAATEASAGDAMTLIESARGGVLYLEEVADVPHVLQPALLKLLHLLNRGSGELRPALDRGYGLRARPELAALPRGEIRLVASTTRELRTLTAIGQFRPDLLAHLSAVELVAPSLRQRIEDLPLLAEWLLRRLSVRTGLTQKVLSGSALAELTERPWDGNLRELEQVVTHAAALAQGQVIEPWHLPPPADAAVQHASGRSSAPPPERLQDVIHQHVVEVLTRCGGNKLRAAEMLGISRSTLYRMLDTGPGGVVGG